ncbi:citrate synthase, putative, partial [Eimeria maxima]
MRGPLVCPLLGAARGPLLPTAAAATTTTARTHLFWVTAVTPSTAAKRKAAAAVAVEAPGACLIGARRSFSSSSSRRRSSSSGGISHGTPGGAVHAAVEALQLSLSAAAAEKQQRMQRLREVYGAAHIGAVTPLSVMGGMRGLTALFTETSRVDAEEGLRLHGMPMRELLLQQLPKAKEDHLYPSVEALLWFLLTSKVPTASEVSLVQRCLYEMTVSAAAAPSAAGGGGATAAAGLGGGVGGSLSLDSYTQERFMRVPAMLPLLLQSLPAEGHPMAAFAAAAAALSDFSFFRAANEEGIVNKKDLWRPALVDALAL